MPRTPARSRPARPTQEDVALARRSSRQLARFARGDLRVRIPRVREEVTIPKTAVRLLVDALSEMAQGHSVALTAVHVELSTQQAANLVGVSRPFLIKELDGLKIPFRKVGTHRRILFQDVLAYKQAIDKRRLATLDELAAQAQELKMGY
ncbi:MAG: excisionase family DNA-binding protein [Planctomycetota bacterium]|nr:excisionase family DNA-binding protein [Planctomycetota bacterium]